MLNFVTLQSLYAPLGPNGSCEGQYENTPDIKQLLWVAKTKVPLTSTHTLTNAQFASEAGQGDPDRKMVPHER